MLEWLTNPNPLVHPHPPMWDQDAVHEIYQRWRKILDSYDGERILVAEAWVMPSDRLAAYIRSDEMHQAFNFDYLKADWDAADPARGHRRLAGRERPGAAPPRPGC